MTRRRVAREDGQNFAKTVTRRYRNALAIAREAVADWNAHSRDGGVGDWGARTDIAFIAQLGDVIDGCNKPVGTSESALQTVLGEVVPVSCAQARGTRGCLLCAVARCQAARASPGGEGVCLRTRLRRVSMRAHAHMPTRRTHARAYTHTHGRPHPHSLSLTRAHARAPRARALPTCTAEKGAKPALSAHDRQPRTLQLFAPRARHETRIQPPWYYTILTKLHYYTVGACL